MLIRGRLAQHYLNTHLPNAVLAESYYHHQNSHVHEPYMVHPSLPRLISYHRAERTRVTAVSSQFLGRITQTQELHHDVSSTELRYHV